MILSYSYIHTHEYKQEAWKKLHYVKFLSPIVVCSKVGITIQETSDQSMAADIARTISCIAWNTPTEYPSLEYNFDTEELKCNSLNQLFQINFQGGEYLQDQKY